MSARNNEERLGIKNPDADAPIEKLSESDSFSFVTPTEFVDLPSKGKFYPEGHPLNGAESVEIRYMTAKDEDILTSQTLLKKGIAIERLLQNIIVDKSIRIDELLVGDKNALIVATRITGYGEDYDINITCPVCNASNPHTVNLSELKTSYVDDDLLTEFNIDKTDNNTFVITLPKSKVNVEVRLLNGRDERQLMVKSEHRKKHKLLEAVLTDQFKSFIVSVNGNDQEKTVSSFIDNMPAYDSRYLRNIYTNITPNIEMQEYFSCLECGNTTEVDVPFTVQFFWPK